MSESCHIRPPGSGHDVKQYLMTAMHLGRLKPGSRVPSVRRMAQLMSLDRKTVHRAYVKLAGEGFLVARRGAGTFIAEETSNTAPVASPTDLMTAVERCLGQAAEVGLSPAEFARVLGLVAEGIARDFPLAVAECNHEQIGLICREVQAALGVSVHPVMVKDSRFNGDAVMRDVRGIVGTSCHRDEVTALAARYGVPAYWVALNGDAADPFLHRARLGRVLMIVRDRNFGRGFGRLLAEMRAAPELVERFSFVETAEAASALRRLDPDAWVYVSPLVDVEKLPLSSRQRQRLIPPPAHVDPVSLQRLKVQVALEIARHGPEAETPARAAAPRASTASLRMSPRSQGAPLQTHPSLHH